MFTVGFLAMHIPWVVRATLAAVGLTTATILVYCFGRMAVLGVRFSGTTVEHRSFFHTTRIPIQIISTVLSKRKGIVTRPVIVCGDREFPLSSIGTLIPAGQKRLADRIGTRIYEMAPIGAEQVGAGVYRRFMIGPWRCLDDGAGNA
jgi:hypothetical protein